MKKPLLSHSIRRAGVRALLVPALLLGCTDLTEVPSDALTPENAFKTEEEILAGVASVYARLRSTMWGYYNLSEITTDEMIVPTRGSDWYDNGRWLEIYRQTWNANSACCMTSIMRFERATPLNRSLHVEFMSSSAEPELAFQVWR